MGRTLTIGLVIRATVGLFLCYGIFIPFWTGQATGCNEGTNELRECETIGGEDSFKPGSYELVKCGKQDWQCCPCGPPPNLPNGAAAETCPEKGCDATGKYTGEKCAEWGCWALWIALGQGIGSIMGFVALIKLFSVAGFDFSKTPDEDATTEAAVNLAFELVYGAVVSPITFFGFIALGVKHGFDDAIVPVVVHGITLCWLAGRIWYAKRFGIGPEGVIMDNFCDIFPLANEVLKDPKTEREDPSGFE